MAEGCDAGCKGGNAREDSISSATTDLSCSQRQTQHTDGLADCARRQWPQARFGLAMRTRHGQRCANSCFPTFAIGVTGRLARAQLIQTMSLKPCTGTLWSRVRAAHRKKQTCPPGGHSTKEDASWTALVRLCIPGRIVSGVEGGGSTDNVGRCLQRAAARGRMRDEQWGRWRPICLSTSAPKLT